MFNILKRHKQKSALNRMIKSAITACINGNCNTVIALSDTDTLYIKRIKTKSKDADKNNS